MSGQSDTESCEDELMNTVDEQAVQSIMDVDDIPFIPPSSVSPNKSPVKTYKIVNGKLLKDEHKSSKHYGSKNTVIKSGSVPKRPRFVLKDGECTRTCSTALYYSSRSETPTMDTLGEESKENDNPDDPEDQISVEDMDLSNVKTEPNNEPSEIDYENICNIEYNNQGPVEYYIHSSEEFDTQEDILLETTNDDCLIETELVFDTDYVEEVGANIELSTEEMVPIYAEIISCDICDEIFEDRKELMRHIQTMHIG